MKIILICLVVALAGCGKEHKVFTDSFKEGVKRQEKATAEAKGGAEATQSMPKIKGFYLGMPSDKAKKILDKLLDKNLQDQVDLHHHSYVLSFRKS